MHDGMSSIAEAPRGNLRPNYSYGSLAAAEQLEALMRHPPPPAVDSLASRRAHAMYGASHISSGMCGLGQFGSAPTHEPTFSGPGSDASGFMGGLDRMDFSQAYGGNMGGNMGGGLMRGVFSESASGGMPMSSSMQQHHASLAAASALGAGGGYYTASRGSCIEDDGAARSSLSMMHSAGAAVRGVQPTPGLASMAQAPAMASAYGGYGGGGGYFGVGSAPGPVMGDSVSPTHMGGMGGMGSMGGGSPQGDGSAGQKRRFVWTPELHQRFEAAVNALGLDSAKPKTILKLMNVDGLTKANIKSHLQKYRCMMAKRSTDSGGKGGEGSGGSYSGLVPSKPGSANGSVDSRSTAALESESFGSMGESTEEDPSAQLDLEGSKTSLHKNLEVQEMTLQVQMELQKELSRQLELQKKLQAEMESLIAANVEVNTNTKMGSILSLKAKLQKDLKDHLRMQHQLLEQLNSVVLPAVERLDTQESDDGTTATASAYADAEKKRAHVSSAPAVSACKNSSLSSDDGDEDDDDEDDDDDEEETPSKRPKAT